MSQLPKAAGTAEDRADTVLLRRCLQTAADRTLKHESEGRAKRHRKQKKPSLYELQHPPDGEPKVIVRLNQWGAVYRCPMCGEGFSQYRINGGPQKEYCSTECQKRATYQWDILEKATLRDDIKGRLDTRVLDQIGQGYLSPLCAHCTMPFPYRIGAGRKRKYCSDACRNAAYEKRYQQRFRHKRKPRYGPCPNCGERVDRKRKDGKIMGRFCTTRCAHTFRERQQRQLERGAIKSDISRGKQEDECM